MKALILVLSLVFMTTSAYANSNLSGTYKAEASNGCQELNLSSATLIVQADTTQFQAFPAWSLSKYSFIVGVEKYDPPVLFNQFATVVDGSYSLSGNQFTAVVSLIDKLNPIPTSQGQVVFTLNGRTLEINDSLAVPGTAGPSVTKTCRLAKIN